MGVEDVEDIGRLAVAELDAERIDQHQAVEPVRAGGGDLGGEPAAERGADQRDLPVRQRVEELAVEVDEVVDRFEVAGPRRGAEARMRRRKDGGAARQALQETSTRVERVKAVQEDDRTPAAAPDDLEIDVANRQSIGARRRCLGHACLLAGSGRCCRRRGQYNPTGAPGYYGAFRRLESTINAGLGTGSRATAVSGSYRAAGRLVLELRNGSQPVPLLVRARASASPAAA